MKQVIEKDVFKVFYNSNLNIFEAQWLDIREEITEERFKACLLEFAQKTIEYQIKGFICDTTKYHYVINPETQIWHDTIIIPMYVQAGIRQIIFLLNEHDLFATLSVEQTFEEEHALNINMHFADTLENAKVYFLETKESVAT